MGSLADVQVAGKSVDNYYLLMTYAALEDQASRGGNVGNLTGMKNVLAQYGWTEVSYLALNSSVTDPKGGGYGARVFKNSDGNVVLVNVGTDAGQVANSNNPLLSQSGLLGGLLFSDDGLTNIANTLAIPNGYFDAAQTQFQAVQSYMKDSSNGATALTIIGESQGGWAQHV